MNALRREHRQVPAARRPRGLQRLAWAAQCMPLSLWHWAAAARRQVPGVQLRGRCLSLAARLALRRAGVPATVLHMLAFWPFDSTRYIELDFAWRRLADLNAGRLLDVSSPRLLPLLLADDRPGLQVDLINPDADDLALTDRLVDGLQLRPRVATHALLAEEAGFPAGAFQAITCISVLEHLPEPAAAIRNLWHWTAEGGRLIVTLPVAAQGVAQVVSQDPYGVGRPDADGSYFMQYLYDQAMLEERFFSSLGRPTATMIYGETTPGALRANLDRKADLSRYPYWAEPTIVAGLLRPFKSISDLPGEGVCGLEFVKHG